MLILRMGAEISRSKSEIDGDSPVIFWSSAGNYGEKYRSYFGSYLKESKFVERTNLVTVVEIWRQ